MLLSGCCRVSPIRFLFCHLILQVAVLEEQKDDTVEEDAAEKATDDAKPIDTDQSTKDENLDEKPDINDVPMEENQVRHYRLYRQQNCCSCAAVHRYLSSGVFGLNTLQFDRYYLLLLEENVNLYWFV